MDCQAFDSTLLDALYDELDERTSAAMDEHAAGCESCANRSSGLKRTQELFRPFLETPFPEGLEARILAASEAAMDARVTSAAGAKVVSLADRRLGAAAVATAQPQAQQKAKSGVVAFLSRPQFAIAAAFVLVLGATALFINSDKSDKSKSASASSPAAATPVGSVASREDDGDQQQNNVNAPPPPPPPSPPTEAVATGTAVASAATIVALAERGATDNPSSFNHRAPAPTSMPRAVGRTGNEPGDLSGLSQSGPSGGSGSGVSNNKGGAASGAAGGEALSQARSLYNAGRYNEALPKFQALAATNVEAELYVARCLAKTKGCDAAAPHYDNAAKRNGSSQAGSTIALEAARCFSSHGQTVAARSRYEKLQTDNYVSSEANAELAAIDAKAGGVKAAKPATTPQAAPPAKAVDESAR